MMGAAKKRVLLAVCSLLVALFAHLPVIFAGCAIEPDNDGHVNIPGTWTKVDKEAFYYCDLLKSVNISNGVTSIGDEAFSRCGNLKSVTIPDSVTSIGDRAFFWCRGLASMTIPAGVTDISEGSFNRCTYLFSVIADCKHMN